MLLSGEPGIGKSRLVRALRDRLADEPHTPLSHFCSPYHTNSALHPVVGLLERAAELKREDPPERQLDKLEALLALGTGDVRGVAPLLADLLAIPTGGRYPTLDLSPQRKKERTLQALVDQLVGLAAKQPVLAVYEDLHWIDPTSLELLGLVVERVRSLRALVVVTCRPEFDPPPWPGHGHVTALSLARLGRHEGAALIGRAAGGAPLPLGVVEEILARTDGVPLFVEELTKAVVETGLSEAEGDGGVGATSSAGAPPAMATIPTTLHDSLLARLDRLGPAKEAAQVGAVIGREFGHGLLAAVAPLDGAALRDALDRLFAVGLVFRRGVPPDATYLFKHALARDAAYASLLRGWRRQLHARVAAVLEERFPEAVEAEPEMLARHCTEAGLTEKAVGYWHRAGQRAIARSAAAEAVAHLGRGLEALAGLPDGSERRRRELDLQVALGGALIAARGYGAEETGRAFSRARELCREEGDLPRLLPVLNGQVLFHNMRAELHAAHEIAAEMLELAQRRDDPALLIPAHRAMSVASLHVGRPAAAREHAERVLALYDPARHRSLATLYAFDQRTVALGFLAVALFTLGYPDQARRRSDEQLDEARRLAHPNTADRMN